MVNDAIGRRQSHTRSSTGKRIRLTDRDLLWLKKLARHGPLPTSYLLAFSSGTHDSEKRAQERLGDLFHEGNTAHGGAYLDRPAQQFATLKAGYNQIVHDISKAGQKALREAGLAEPGSIHHGPWLHRHMVACTTASIELATLARSDLSFIPGSAVLDRAGSELRVPVTTPHPDTGRPNTKDLIPDALFGVEYHTDRGSRYRFFVVEADRGTEPVTSRSWNRKSFLRHLAQYQAYVAEGRIQIPSWPHRAAAGAECYLRCIQGGFDAQMYRATIGRLFVSAVSNVSGLRKTLATARASCGVSRRVVVAGRVCPVSD